jgi:hypothetical protein
MAKRRKNASSGGSSLLTLGLVAIGGYVVYELFFATPTTAASTTTSGSGSGSSGSSTGGSSSTGSSSTGSTGSSPAGPAPVPAVPATPPLDDIYTAMVASIPAADGNFTGTGSSITGTPYHFGVYLALAAPSATIPDPSVVFGSATGADQPMTAAAYWSLMGPALASANPGLSGFGLGRYAGVGAYMRGLGAFSWR